MSQPSHEPQASHDPKVNHDRKVSHGNVLVLRESSFLSHEPKATHGDTFVNNEPKESYGSLMVSHDLKVSESNEEPCSSGEPANLASGTREFTIFEPVIESAGAQSKLADTGSLYLEGGLLDNNAGNDKSAASDTSHNQSAAQLQSEISEPALKSGGGGEWSPVAEPEFVVATAAEAASCGLSHPPQNDRVGGAADDQLSSGGGLSSRTGSMQSESEELLCSLSSSGSIGSSSSGCGRKQSTGTRSETSFSLAGATISGEIDGCMDRWMD